MAKVWNEITPELQSFITQQPIFFVASAPLAPDGHINLSPKGLNRVQVLSPKQVAYLDLTGSGNETSAHLQENGRITLLFCAFEGNPMILRLYGQGRVILPEHPEWEPLQNHFDPLPGARQIMVIDVQRVQTSCGFGIPLLDYQGQREVLVDWAAKKGPDAVAQYQQEKGAQSIDGLVTPIGATRVQG
jgi:Pyridoxamine 5'-phosphate oxidase